MTTVKQIAARRFFGLSLATIVMSSLAGCSWIGMGETFRDRSNDYRRSADMPTIDVPENLDSDAVGELYPIPEGGRVASYQVSDEFEVPRPRSVALNDAANEVRIQMLGDDAWILVSVPPGESWPRVRGFLARQAIPTASADATQGTIETGWFTLSDDPDNYQQFLITLSQGVQLNTTEIEILQRNFPLDGVPEELPPWADISFDAERETWMRDNLATALAEDYGEGSASLLGSEIGAASKVDIVTPGDQNPYLDMRLSYQRVWASVGYALSSEGFEIIEQSSESGYYVAEYVDPVLEDVGFWKRMFSGGRPAPESYRVRVETKGDGAEVRVFTAENEEMNQRETFIVLERIRANLT